MRLRSFRNSDPPQLVRVWNRSIPRSSAAVPLRVHELDTHAFGSVLFDPAGLIVAEQDGQIVGFVHAGFGPPTPIEASRPLRLDRSLGTISMLAVDSTETANRVSRSLVLAAERYLLDRGTQVLYAGSLFPLNPFYWGLYGGSEGAGIVASHDSFRRCVIEMGYEPSSSTLLLEADLSRAETRDPRAVVIRRAHRIEVEDDPCPRHWWEALAIGEFHLGHLHLISKANDAEIGRVAVWDMDWYSREDERPRLGLIDLEVAVEHRRKGYGRFLVAEVLRLAREQSFALVELQTNANNLPALSLYAGLGFSTVEQATLFRLPTELMGRSRSESTAELDSPESWT
jgi:ribosomal protein S18 acetylase RimI-like enzyme